MAIEVALWVGNRKVEDDFIDRRKGFYIYAGIRYAKQSDGAETKTPLYQLGMLFGRP